MKKVLFTLLVVMMIGITASFAQKKLYFCSDYTASGEPLETSSVWNIASTGGYVYMVYKNGGVNIDAWVIYVFIDKMDEATKEYKAYATKNLVPYKFMNWALYDFKFTEAGEYKVKFLDDKYAELATDYLTIKMKENSNSSNKLGGGAGGEPSSSSKLDYGYYEGAKVQFCEDVTDNGEAVTPADVFNIPSSGGWVKVLVDAGKEFKTDQFVVDVYSGDDYATFVETKNIDVTPTYHWTWFKYTFYKAGKYKLAIYNKDWTHIQTGYVTINNK